MDDVARVTIDNPDFVGQPEEPPRIKVERRLTDPLTRLKHTRRIDDVEFAAGCKMQRLMEIADVARVRSGALREYIDHAVGPREVSPRKLSAMREIGVIRALLGRDGAALVQAVLGGGMLPEQYAKAIGRGGRDDMRATGRAFKWHLASLAEHFGLAGRA